MKIVHISDLHLCNVHKKINTLYLQTILDYVKVTKPDHLVITGDISDNVRDEDFELLRNMLGNYNLLRPEMLSITIGNHDIFGTVQKLEDLIAFPNKCKKVNYEKNVETFCRYFSETFIDCYFPSKDSFFPYAKRVGDYIFIGINSIRKYSKIKNPFASNGKIGKQELLDIEKIFRKNDYSDRSKIILIHHHFYKDNLCFKQGGHNLWKNIDVLTMKLRKKKSLLNLFKKNNVKLVLHGHYHASEEYWRDGIRFSNAGDTINETSDLKINCIHLTRDTFNIKVIRLPKPALSSYRTHSMKKVKELEAIRKPVPESIYNNTMV